MLKKIQSILTNKWYITTLIIMLFFPSYYNHLKIRIDVTQQDSLPYKWWVTEKPFNKQQYILFKPPLDKYTQGANFYLKKIGCKPKQKLKTINNVYFCDGKKITVAQNYDLDGLPLKHLKFDLIIPDNMYFVIGTHKYSYDSKYFGLITKRQIVRGATPLIKYFNGEK